MGCKHNEFFNYQCICTINRQISLGCAILNLLLVQVVGIEKSSQNDKLLSLTKEVGRTIFANINYILSKFHEIAQEFGEIVTAGTNIKKMCNHQEIQQQSIMLATSKNFMPKYPKRNFGHYSSIGRYSLVKFTVLQQYSKFSHIHALHTWIRMTVHLIGQITDAT